MRGATSDGFLGRIAARTRPSGALKTVENKKTIVLVLTSGLWAAAGFSTAFAFTLFDLAEPSMAWVSLGLAVAYLVSWLVYFVTGSVAMCALVLASSSLVAQVALHVGLGGYGNSGAYLMWGVTMTFTVALLVGRRAALATAGLYIAIAVALGFVEQSLSASRPAPAATLSTTLFVIVLVGNVLLLTSLLVYFLGRLAFERERAEGLLRNVLPAQVAVELKEFGKTKARRFESISVMFADVVGFTPMSADTPPEQVVDELNEIFTHFDALAAEHGCEKIRTIGDAYMVAAGVPVPRGDHAEALASMALEMLAYSENGPLRFRVGISSGPAVAGVIGIAKFQYDLWGDTVNTASRMESHGEPGRIQISESTYRLIETSFECTPRGPVEIKGKGTLNTWFVEGRRDV